MATPAEVLAVVLPVLVGIALIALASVVIRHGGGHRFNVFFAALYILSGLKSMSEGLDQVATQFNEKAPLFPPTLFWQLLAAFCGLAMLPLLFAFVASFPRPVNWMVRRPGLAVLAAWPSVVMGCILTVAVLDPSYVRLYLDVVPVFNVLGVALSVIALLLILRTRRDSPDTVERTQARYVAVGFLPAFFFGWVITGIQFLFDGGAVSATTANGLTADIVHYLSPMAELFAAGLVAFAILKYNILGIQPGFRLGVKSFVVGFVFATVFLLTQFVENVILQGQLFGFADDFTGGYGSFILSGVTGLVLFKPIERVSERVSDRLLPRAPDDGPGARAAEIYQAQCTYVLRDAHVSEREMALLRNLRAQLGLTDGQARAIEERVERILHVDAPQTGATAATEPHRIAAAHATTARGDVEVRRASPLPGGPAKHVGKAPAGTAGARPQAAARPMGPASTPQAAAGPRTAPRKPGAATPAPRRKATGKAAASPARGAPKKATRRGGGTTK